MVRQILAGIMGGVHYPPHELNSLGDALLDGARDEGVEALVKHRLAGQPGVNPQLTAHFAAPVRDRAVTAMLFEAEARRVLAVLGEAAIPLLLLKGSALAYWLYATPYLRDCADIDLLFRSRADAEHAAALLAPHGYELEHPASDLAYEMPCYLKREGVRRLELDMHWRLSNAPFLANTFAFEELLARSISVSRLGPHARGLSPPDALIHACMHRALNLFFEADGDRLKWLYDIHLLCASLASLEWTALLEACRGRGLHGICLDGIEAASAEFGTVVPAGMLDALSAGAASERLDAKRLRSWTYLHVLNLKALPNLRTRVRWIGEQVFLPLPTMRVRYGNDGDSLWLLHWQRVLRASRHLKAWAIRKVGL